VTEQCFTPRPVSNVPTVSGSSAARHGLSRRQVLALGVAAGALTVLPAPVRAVTGGGSYGFSPLGTLRYPAGFQSFDYVDPDAPKGGTLRLIRIGAFGTFDTLNYPGHPADDIRLIYDRLVVESEDEAASYYGLLAEEIAVAPDYGELVFTMRPEAAWHDGRPVTAADVAFTFATLKATGAPYYRQAFRPLEVTADGGRVIVRNSRRGDRDVVRRLATIPVHPRHVWENGKPQWPVGSGPMRLEAFDPPRHLRLERVADYWGHDLAVNRGRWNFDRIAVDFLRDDDVALAAFKAGDADVRTETDPQRWRVGYEGPMVGSGEIRRQETATASVGSLHGLAVNLRRPALADRRVRLALLLATDTAEMNRLLFDDAYGTFASVFAGTPLEATGPASDAERDLLGALPPGAGEDPDPLAGLPAAGSREALRLASDLLAEAGFALAGECRTGPDGAPLSLATVSVSPAYERVLLFIARAWQRIGVTLEIVRTDPASASRRMLDKDFDLATLSWSPARLPGTAERLLWHSALADAPGSYALSGLKSAAVDAAIEALGSASDAESLALAGKAFDRAFRGEIALLPLYREDTIRTAWWDRFGRPAAEQNGFPPSALDRWWAKA